MRTSLITFVDREGRLMPLSSDRHGSRGPPVPASPRRAWLLPRAAAPLRVDRAPAVLLRDPLRPGRAAQLRRVRAAVGGGLRRLARHDHAHRLALVPGLRRLATVRRAGGGPLRHPPRAG